MEDLRVVTKGFGLPASDPTQLFLQLVATKGGIASGLKEWINAMQRKPEYGDIRRRLIEEMQAVAPSALEGDSLEALRAQIVRFEGSVTESAEGNQDIKSSEVLRFLPGVTFAEIKQALGEQEDSKQPSAIGSSLRLCRLKGVLDSDIVYSLRNATGANDLPVPRFVQALRKRLVSAANAPGVLAYLGARSVAEAEKAVQLARDTLSAQLRPFGIPGHDAVVEMRLWGIRLTDLRVSDGDFSRAIWEDSSTQGVAVDSDQLASSLLVARAQTLGLAKAYRALGELVSRSSAVTPQELVQVAVKAITGGDRGFVSEGDFKTGESVEFIAGNRMPTPQQLKGAVALAGIPFTPAMQMSWGLEFASFLDRRGVAPLGRLLLCQIVERDFRSEAPQQPVLPRNFIEKTINRFLEDSGPSEERYRKVLFDACEGRDVSPTDIGAIADALKYKNGAPIRGILAAVSKHKDAGAGLFSWCDKTVSKRGSIAFFLRAAGYVRQEHRSRVAFTSGSSSMEGLIARSIAGIATSTDAQKLQCPIADYAHLVGFTSEELIQVLIRVENEVEIADTSKVRPKTSSPPPSRWIDQRHLGLSLTETLELIAQRLQGGSPVTNLNLLELLPYSSAFTTEQERDSCRKLINAVAREVAGDTPWLIAATAYYKYPDGALRELVNLLQSGQNMTFDAPVFYEKHVDAVKQRGNKGKLEQPAFMRWFFRDPVQFS